MSPLLGLEDTPNIIPALERGIGPLPDSSVPYRFIDTLGAMFRREAPLVSFGLEELPGGFNRLEQTGLELLGFNFEKENAPDPNFDPVSASEGTVLEGIPSMLEGVDNQFKLSAKIKQAYEEQDAIDRLTRAGIGQSLAAGLIVGITDPINLAIGTLLTPGALVGKLATTLPRAMLAGAALGGVAQVAIEATLEPTQMLRDPSEALANILLSAGFGSLFGAGLRAAYGIKASRVSRPVLNDREMVRTALGLPPMDPNEPDIPHSFLGLEGAFRRRGQPPGGGGPPGLPPSYDYSGKILLDPDELERDIGLDLLQQLNQGAGEKLAKLYALDHLKRQFWFNPILRIAIASKLITSRRALQLMVDTSLVWKKNAQGIMTPHSAESEALSFRIQLAGAVQETTSAWHEYRTGKPGGTGKALLEEARGLISRDPLKKGKLSRPEFVVAVGKAIAAGHSATGLAIDEAAKPFVERVARFYTNTVFEPGFDAMVQVGFFKANARQQTALGYLTRLYRQGEINARRSEWDSIVSRYFMSEGLTVNEAATATEEVTNRILGTFEGELHFDIAYWDPRVVRHRNFNIPDKQIEDFLERDVEVIAQLYTRQVGASVAIGRRFRRPAPPPPAQRGEAAGPSPTPATAEPIAAAVGAERVTREPPASASTPLGDTVLPISGPDDAIAQEALDSIQEATQTVVEAEVRGSESFPTVDRPLDSLNAAHEALVRMTEDPTPENHKAGLQTIRQARRSFLALRKKAEELWSADEAELPEARQVLETLTEAAQELERMAGEVELLRPGRQNAARKQAASESEVADRSADPGPARRPVTGERKPSRFWDEPSRLSRGDEPTFDRIFDDQGGQNVFGLRVDLSDSAGKATSGTVLRLEGRGLMVIRLDGIDASVRMSRGEVEIHLTEWGEPIYNQAPFFKGQVKKPGVGLGHQRRRSQEDVELEESAQARATPADLDRVAELKAERAERIQQIRDRARDRSRDPNLTEEQRQAFLDQAEDEIAGLPRQTFQVAPEGRLRKLRPPPEETGAVFGEREGPWLDRPDEALTAQESLEMQAARTARRHGRPTPEETAVRAEPTPRELTDLERETAAEADEVNATKVRKKLQEDREQAAAHDADQNSKLGSQEPRVPVGGGEPLPPKAGDFGDSGTIPDLELTEMKRLVRSEAEKRASLAPNEREKTRIHAMAEADIKDLEALRDIMFGRYGQPKDPNSLLVRAGRAMRRWNYLTYGGGFVISNLPDVARPFMVDGIFRGFQYHVLPFLKDMEGVKILDEDLRSIGLSAEMALNSRTLANFDLGDDFLTGNAFERALKKGTDTFAMVSLLTPWNHFAKRWAAMGTTQRILEDVLLMDRFFGDNLSYVKQQLGDRAFAKQLARAEKARERLAFLGIGEISGPKDANLPHVMVSKIAMELDGKRRTSGLLIPDFDNWADKDLSKQVQQAIRTEVNRVIVTPGVGDRPLLMSKEWGRLIFQFKSFGFASVQRMLLSGIQQGDAAFLNGLLLTTAAGMVVYKLKSEQLGFPTSNDPKVWIREGIDRGGALAMFQDVNNSFSALTSGRIAAGNVFIGGVNRDRFGNRGFLDTMLGPTGGQFSRLGQVISAVPEVGSEGGVPLRKVRSFYRMMPLRSYFALDPLFDAAERGTAHVLGPHRGARIPVEAFPAAEGASL